MRNRFSPQGFKNFLVLTKQVVLKLEFHLVVSVELFGGATEISVGTADVVDDVVVFPQILSLNLFDLFDELDIGDLIVSDFLGEANGDHNNPGAHFNYIVSRLCIRLAVIRLHRVIQTIIQRQHLF